MATRQATGTAGGSPQHTPKQVDTTEPEAAAQADSNPLSALTNEQIAQLLDLWKSQHDEERRAADAFKRVMDLNEAHTQVLTPAQLEALAKLREPFAADQISKRPQPWCKACNNAPGRVCNNHKMIKCETCGTRITDAHTDLDYVGHAGITDRLLSVDPTWDWEPLSTDANGLPLFDQHGGLWIKLTVCGMVRKGYGDAVGKKAGTTAVKETIGDAIRNAAMRFGMALDLWSKTDLHKETEPEPHPAEKYLDAIKQRHVWQSTKLLTGVRTEAEEAGHLDYVVGSGGVTLGEVIDEQLEQIEKSAEAEARIRVEQEEKRKAAAQQVAAEHGVRSQAAGQAGAPPAQQPPAEGPQTADEIRAACGGDWNNPDALEHLHKAARRLRVDNEPAYPEEPERGALGRVIRQRVNDLRRAAAQRGASAGQPAGAAHQYTDHEGNWGYGDDAAG
ncbi:hypothetical protein ABZ619_39275 [Streptomyces sp. NPDC007851]|uniref:hypothetical protein n=1 Tax=Streptomyces sp. NPDC007851 TaxID=3155008 RepID=UPI00340832A7